MASFFHFLHDFVTFIISLCHFQSNTIRNHVFVLHKNLDEIEAFVTEQQHQVVFTFPVAFSIFQNFKNFMRLLLRDCCVVKIL